jgi:hypothetical protein
VNSDKELALKTDQELDPGNNIIVGYPDLELASLILAKPFKCEGKVGIPLDHK